MNLKQYWHASSNGVLADRQEGSALIIVLAFVVLLTVVAVAFYSRAASDRQVSFSSSNQTKAELLARGAVAGISGDLKQEIAAGSTVATVFGATIYVPRVASTLTPVLVGSTGTGGLENLVKRSAYLSPFYPSSVNYDTATYPASNRAAGPSAQNATTVPSFNGRSVSRARWNKSFLLQKKTPTSDTDATPVDAFSAPDWINVARDGSNPPVWNANMKISPTNASSVIGRYAYTIYDEGGLLDMNVAGHPTANTTVQVGRKGFTAFADSTQIPGISSLTAGNQTKFVNNIVGWRNFSSAAAAGNLGTFVSGAFYSFASGAPFYNSVLSNTNGFLLTCNSALNGNQSDRKLSGRQELIALLTRGMASTATDRANLQVGLQYLGTFSRELNRPSWKPSTPLGSNIDYAALAENPTAINRDLATVRVTGGFTRADGTQAIVGEALLKTRFPLTRINELTNTSNTYIQRDFGLSWNATQNRWDYVVAGGSRIERLDEVAAENREPNFFEILKAVILSGSVGLGSGTPTANTFVISEPKYYSTTNNLSADYQIMQIGANIIDAWDADNIPTFIKFANNELAGVENLPYISKIVYDFWLSNHGNNGDHDEWSAWLVPSLWNPHQNAASAPATQDVRLVMTSGSVTGWLDLGNRGIFQTPTIVSTGTTPYVELKASQFATPYPPAPGKENGSPPHSPEIGPVSEGPCNPSCYDGIALADHIPTEKQAYKRVNKSYPMFAPGTTFQMQVQTTNGNWKAYQSWNGCSNGTNSPSIYSPGRNKFNNLQDPEFVSLDPRTVRFGVWGSDADGAGNDSDFTTGLELTMDENNGGSTPELITGLKPQLSSLVTSDSQKSTYLYSANVTTPTAGITEYYKDLDGVVRRGDFTTDANGTANTKTIMYPANSADRPQINWPLSSPFQSVAELGQVFRDQPWKTLNFTTSNSGDAGLLDAFTLQDVPMIAGRTSLNTRQTAVLTAILSQTTKNLVGTNVITSAQASNIVTALANLTAANPMISKGELVSRLAADPSVAALGNQEARECVVRAFSDACQTRTWNVMIDVIAQSGRYPPTAGNLSQFVVEGEKRYWLHIAIDRFTGQIVDQQLEAVYE